MARVQEGGGYGSRPPQCSLCNIDPPAFRLIGKEAWLCWRCVKLYRQHEVTQL